MPRVGSGAKASTLNAGCDAALCARRCLTPTLKIVIFPAESYFSYGWVEGYGVRRGADKRGTTRPSMNHRILLIVPWLTEESAV